MIPGDPVFGWWTNDADAEPPATPANRRKDLVAFSLMHGRRFALILALVLLS